MGSEQDLKPSVVQQGFGLRRDRDNYFNSQTGIRSPLDCSTDTRQFVVDASLLDFTNYENKLRQRAPGAGWPIGDGGADICSPS